MLDKKGKKYIITRRRVKRIEYRMAASHLFHLQHITDIRITEVFSLFDHPITVYTPGLVHIRRISSIFIDV